MLAGGDALYTPRTRGWVWAWAVLGPRGAWVRGTGHTARAGVRSVPGLGAPHPACSNGGDDDCAHLCYTLSVWRASFRAACVSYHHSPHYPAPSGWWSPPWGRGLPEAACR